MSRKESKFYVINFIDPRIIFLKKKLWRHVQWKRIFRYRIKKVNRKEGDACKAVNGSKQLSYWCSGTLVFLECSSMLNSVPETNAYLSYTWLSKCFFSNVFFFYIVSTFLSYRLFDNVLMKMYSLCGRCGDRKAFKETKYVQK